MKINNSAKRTIQILELISENPNGLTLGEISATLDIPKTSAYDILVTLKQFDVIEVADERQKSYIIGSKAFIIGNSYIQNSDIIKISAKILEDVGDKLGRTIFIGKEDHNRVIYLYKYEPINTIITTCNIGTVNNLFTTSLGRAILSGKESLTRYLESSEFKEQCRIGNIDENEFVRIMGKARLQGFVENSRAIDKHLHCIGVPVYNQCGEVECSISASGLYVENDDVSHVINEMKEAARMISKKLGYNATSI